MGQATPKKLFIDGVYLCLAELRFVVSVAEHALHVGVVVVVGIDSVDSGAYTPIHRILRMGLHLQSSSSSPSRLRLRRGAMSPLARQELVQEEAASASTKVRQAEIHDPLPLNLDHVEASPFASRNALILS
ncbi:hypothetical protein PPROV_000471800 [Pycnococcus provasolii]|uniref:Uncharacterized protein n=1 Tax=Pycnococcus provasolii TaxID=41880 RepID=A0A830HK84_9CHLO|nr:hypothetical protein PPROV_000471800 [Pycnococcus provasolii]